MTIRLLILTLFFTLNTSLLKATHLMGGEITWKCIKSGNNSGKYVFEVKVYRDCQGVSIATSSSLICHNIPGMDTISLAWVSGTDISPSCDTTNGPNPQFTCNGLNVGFAGNGNGAVEEHIYRSDTIRILGTPDANGWHFTWSDCCRNLNITNLQNVSSNSVGFTLRAVMYSYTDSLGAVHPNNGNCYDSSPEFFEKPRTILEVGNGYDPLAFSNGFTYSHNAFDEEQDSLCYTWGEPLSDIGYDYLNPNSTSLPFVSGYSYTSPINGIVMNNETGRTYYPASQQGNYVTCTNVSAYKCGQLVSEIFREVQVVLIPPTCNLGDTTNGNTGADTLCNTRPLVQPPFFYAGSSSPYQWDTIVHCGDTVTFDFIANDNDVYPNGSLQDLLFEVSGGQFFNYNQGIPCQNPPCATFTEINTGALPPFVSAGGTGSGKFEWITACNHVLNSCEGDPQPSVYTFVIKVQDDFCPAPAIENTSQVISITVYPPCGDIKANEIVTAESLCGSQDGSITVNPSGGFAPYNTYFFDMNGIPVNPGSLYAGDYQIRITDISMCELIDTITVPGPPTVFYNNLQSICIGDSISVGLSTYTLSGTYTDTFTASNGCDSIVTTILTVLNPTNSVNNQTVCYGDAFVFNGNSYTVSGSYSDTLSNSNGCDSIITTNLTVLNQINTTNLINSVSCNGGSNGSIDVAVSGGMPPYSFLWSNGSTSEDLTSIASGIYYLQIIDSNGCIYNDTVNVTEPAILQAVITDSSSTLTGLAAGGTPTYNYEFYGPNGLLLTGGNNNGTPVSINAITIGYYTFIVIDANGCIDSNTVYISNNFSPTLTVSLSNNWCDSISELTITVEQDSGEVDMSTGLFQSNGGYFNISGFNTGDTIGTAYLSAGGGFLNLNTYIMISTIISPNQAIVVSCDSLLGCVGSFQIANNPSGGIEVLTQTVPDSNNYTNGNMSSITFDSIFVNPCSPLVFTYTINSELGDVLIDSVTFVITSNNYLESYPFIVYPNPTTGELYIKFSSQQNNVRVKLLDMQGKQTYLDESYQDSETKRLSLADFNKGAYLLIIESEGSQYSKTIIVQ